MDVFISGKGNNRNALSDLVHNYLSTFLVVTVVIWCVQLLWKRRYLYIYSWNVEGPLAFPIIGCGYLIIGNKIGVIRTLMKVQESASSGVARMWLGPQLVYLLDEPALIEQLLNHPKALEKDGTYSFITKLFGSGLLTAPVKRWKKHRKMLNPAFNQKILDTFVEMFAEQSALFAEGLKSVVGKKDFDLSVLATRCTLDMICQTAMGVNMNVQKEKSSYGENLQTVLSIVTFRVFRIWYHLDLIWHFIPLRKVLETNVKMVKDMTSSIISRKMAEHKNNTIQSCIEAEIEEVPTKKRLAVLDILLKESVLTEEDLRDEVEIFLAAGTETSASSLCCLFTMLGMHPEVQQKVYEEVIDIVGPDRIITASDLHEMKYTERVIKENLRLFPPSAIFARSMEEDIDLGKFILPAGSSVAIITLHIHRNPKYWPDPLKFDPDRFLPEEVAKRHPCTYIPFSYGSRNCIGWKYALMSLKTIIATVIRRYKIFTLYKSVDEIDLDIHMVLKMTDGPKVWIEYR